jgi:transcriptional regulator with XRE-family HTH domain
VDPSSLGDRIRLLRKKHRITQEEFGNILHVSKSMVSDIEHGRRRVHAELLRDIADVLGVSTDYLLGRLEASASQESD